MNTQALICYLGVGPSYKCFSVQALNVDIPVFRICLLLHLFVSNYLSLLFILCCCPVQFIFTPLTLTFYSYLQLVRENLQATPHPGQPQANNRKIPTQTSLKPVVILSLASDPFLKMVSSSYCLGRRMTQVF